MDNLFDMLFSSEQEESRIRRLNGVVVGIITNNNDPDHLGKVKIHFPWLSDNNESDWARICSFMAGGKRGSFFLPEANDEVLVAFEHGDINRPYVIGSLHSIEDQPPEGNLDGKNNIRKITSRSGSEIIFNDDQGKETLEIHTSAGHKILLDDGSGKINIIDKTKANSIEIDSSVSGSITISSQSGSINLKADTIDITALTSLSLNTKGNLNLKGTMVNIN